MHAGPLWRVIWLLRRSASSVWARKLQLEHSSVDTHTHTHTDHLKRGAKRAAAPSRPFVFSSLETVCPTRGRCLVITEIPGPGRRRQGGGDKSRHWFAAMETDKGVKLHLGEVGVIADGEGKALVWVVWHAGADVGEEEVDGVVELLNPTWEVSDGLVHDDRTFSLTWRRWCSQVSALFVREMISFSPHHCFIYLLFVGVCEQISLP